MSVGEREKATPFIVRTFTYVRVYLCVWHKFYSIFVQNFAFISHIYSVHTDQITKQTTLLFTFS